MNAPDAQPQWRMSLAGSELARVAQEGDELVLVFAVAQVRPAQSPRFGQGDNTAYVSGVVWRLQDVDCAQTVPGGLVGRLTDSELWVYGEVRARLAFDLPGTVTGPLTLRLCTALGAVWTRQAQGLTVLLSDGSVPRPSLAC